MRAGLWVGILCIVWGLLPLQTIVAQGNKKAKVKIVNADSLLVGTLGKPSRFIGNVHMTHENTLMWCDSLYQYELPDSNYLEAFGHVRVIKNDSIRMSGDYMYYDANKKLIQVRRNVTLEDPQMVLTTDFLDYDGLFDIGYYFNWGQLKDSQNTLDSKKGNYFTQTKIALFKDSVKVNSPEYLIFSDTLKYNTETKLVSILGPTNIYGKGEDNNTLYSEDGWYDSNLGHAELYKNNRVTHLSYEGVADTMVIDSITGMAYLYWNVTLVDTVNNVIVKGEYAQMDREQNKAFVTDSALLIMVGKQDSLFVHGDTLFMDQDSAKNQILRAYYKVKFFSQDLQGLCDSMVYLSVDSTITLYNEPVAWASGNQMTAEKISLLTGNGTIKEFYLNTKAFMVSRREETEMYDQIKGRNMTGYFRDNELYMVYVNGNGETIYFPDDKGNIIGVNTANSSNIRIMIDKRKVTDIVFINKPDGELNPLFLADPEEARLKDFRWLKYMQPLNKFDIFKETQEPEPVEKEEEEKE